VKSGHYISGHNSPADSARELFKSSTDSASPLVSIKKNYFIWLGVLLWGRRKVGMFLKFWQTFTDPGRQSNEPIFCPNFFGNWTIIRVFTALDWPSSMSENWNLYWTTNYVRSRVWNTVRAGLKSRGARGNFYWRAPMT